MTPPSLASRPVLDSRQIYYYNTFQRISRSRSASMAGALPIPISEIRAYCEFLEIHNVELKERILGHVINLDNTYLAYLDTKSKEDAKDKSKKK